MLVITPPLLLLRLVPETRRDRHAGLFGRELSSRSLVVSFAEIAARTASSTSLLNVWKPRYSNIIAEVRIDPIGFAIPLPASGGALPCTGSNNETLPG